MRHLTDQESSIVPHSHHSVSVNLSLDAERLNRFNTGQVLLGLAIPIGDLRRLNEYKCA